jgi:hypothetical protein
VASALTGCPNTSLGRMLAPPPTRKRRGAVGHRASRSGLPARLSWPAPLHPDPTSTGCWPTWSTPTRPGKSLGRRRAASLPGRRLKPRPYGNHPTHSRRQPTAFLLQPSKTSSPPYPPPTNPRLLGLSSPSVRIHRRLRKRGCQIRDAPCRLASSLNNYPCGCRLGRKASDASSHGADAAAIHRRTCQDRPEAVPADLAGSTDNNLLPAAGRPGTAGRRAWPQRGKPTPSTELATPSRDDSCPNWRCRSSTPLAAGRPGSEPRRLRRRRGSAAIHDGLSRTGPRRSAAWPVT